MKLEEEINQYGELKSAADSYKKQAEAENAVIKKYMLENDLTSAQSDKYSVSCKTITSQSFNDEKVIVLQDTEYLSDFADVKSFSTIYFLMTVFSASACFL